MNNEIIPIYHLGNFSGFYDRKLRVFTKYRKQQDIIRKFNGISISISVLERVKKLGCEDIKVLIQMNNGQTKEYRTKLNRWFDHGIIFNHKLDYQRILTISQLEGGKEDLSNINFGKKAVTKIEEKEAEIIEEMKINIRKTKGADFYRSTKEERVRRKAIAYSVPLRAFFNLSS